jgi:hypothetical protein
MSRSGSVGSRQGPSSERALPTARRLEHGATDDGRPRRDPGKQQAAGDLRERRQIDPRIAVGDLGELAITTVRTRRWLTPGITSSATWRPRAWQRGAVAAATRNRPSGKTPAPAGQTSGMRRGGLVVTRNRREPAEVNQPVDQGRATWPAFARPCPAAWAVGTFHTRLLAKEPQGYFVFPSHHQSP